MTISDYIYYTLIAETNTKSYSYLIYEIERAYSFKMNDFDIQDYLNDYKLIVNKE